MNDNIDGSDYNFEAEYNALEFARRSYIMRQLLCELFAMNSEIERTKVRPLDVIIEEVTPCSSSQLLDNNLSVIKHNLTPRTPSDEEASFRESDDEFEETIGFIQNKQLLKNYYDRNMYIIKKNTQFTGNVTTESSSSSASSHFTNVTNDSIKNKKIHSDKEKFSKITDILADKNMCKYINDDEHYVKSECSRNQFRNLNKNFEKYNTKKKPPTPSIIQTNNTIRSLWKINKEVEPKPKPNRENICGDVNFTCMRTYAVNAKSNNTAKEVLSLADIEKKVKHFEEQVKQLQKFQEDIQFNNQTLKLKSLSNSSEEEFSKCPSWRNKLKKTFNLDRGDFRLNDNKVQSFNESYENVQYHDSSNDISNTSSRENKSLNNSEQSFDEESIIIEEPTYPGGIILVKNLSKDTNDSGLYTENTQQNNKKLCDHENNDHYSQNELYPKVMYASSHKSISTQVTDSDWLKICASKREMAKQGTLTLSLPNSSDEHFVEEQNKVKKRVDFITEVTVLKRNKLDTSTESTPASTNRGNLYNKLCYCFPCSNILRFFRKH